MRLEWLAVALCRALVVACAAGPAAAEPAPQLPIEAFFREPLMRGAALSPNGRYLASIASSDRTQYLVIWDLETNQKKPVKRFSKDESWRGQRAEQLAYWVGWASDARVLFALQYRIVHMAETVVGFHVYGVDRDGGNERRLLDGLPDFQAPRRMDADPDHFLIQQDGGLYRVHVRTGESRLYHAERTGVDWWIRDPRDRVRLGIGYSGLRYSIQLVTPAKSLEPLREGQLYFEPAFVPLGFGPDDDTLYVASDHESETLALYAFDLPSRSFREKLFGHPEFDVAEDLVFSLRRNALLAVPYYEDSLRFHFFDADFEHHMKLLERALPGRSISLADWDRDESRWILRASGDVEPPATYLYVPAKKQLQKLFDEHPELPSERLSPTRALSIRARDGLALRSYLSVPRGMAENRLPLVVLPHGGPHSRDRIEWDPELQFLASRGYAVLRVNFRGSRGFGRKLLTAGYKQWGGAMQDDLSDAARWLVEQRIADPDRIAIYGSSYGGYAALMGLIREPALFRCAVSFAGVTDLQDQLQQESRYRTWADLNLHLVGDRVSDGPLLRSRSPAANAGRIQAPVLIAHGEKDGIVHPRQARSMTRALAAAGKPYEELTLPDEGHALHSAESRLRFYRALEAFLARHMQPRSAPTAAPARPPAS